MRLKFILSSVFLAGLGTSIAAPATQTTSEPNRTEPHSMPRYFEANRGQWPAGEAFRAYGYGYGIALRQNGVTLRVSDPKAARSAGKTGSQAASPREVSLRFEGASSESRLTGLGQLAAKGAWFQGAEADWRSGIPLFERIREERLYPGVNATFYGREGQLEYDLDLDPGAKTGALVLDLDGANHATIGKNGDLTIEVNGQQIVLHKPTAWQPAGASRKTVDVGYSLLPGARNHGQRIGLQLNGYDKSKPLTIDPVLTFATYLSSATSALPDY